MGNEAHSHRAGLNLIRVMLHLQHEVGYTFIASNADMEQILSIESVQTPRANFLLPLTNHSNISIIFQSYILTPFIFSS